MWIVIDSNRMASNELHAFLSHSPANRAVLTDYAAMEAFKGDTIVSITASWAVLRLFPKQVLALKGTRHSTIVSPEAPGMCKRMVSKSETKGVLSFSELLDRAAGGDPFIQRQLLQRGQWADAHLQKMLEEAASINVSIAEFTAMFSPSELKRIRTNDLWTEDMGEKFRKLTEESTLTSFTKHPDKPLIPKSKHLINHFLYRYTLTYLIYMLRLVEKGALSRKVERARNDVVDIMFATYATYFNGLMSGDDEASTIHLIARTILKAGGARIPEDYLDRYVHIFANEIKTGASN